jgi:hypothetical protein
MKNIQYRCNLCKTLIITTEEHITKNNEPQGQAYYWRWIQQAKRNGLVITPNFFLEEAQFHICNQCLHDIKSA